MNTQINNAVFEVFPVLESKRLHFRAFQLKDRAELYALRTDPEVMRYMDAYPYASEQEAATAIRRDQTAFQEKRGINWAIVEKTQQRFMGYFGYWRLFRDQCRAELGYSLRRDAWGQGYMSETFQTLLPFAFERLQVHSLMANVNPQNQSSIKVLEKHGFVQEAHFKEDYFFDGRFIDSLIFCRLEP